MGLHKRSELGPLLDRIGRGERRQVYLCFGERYLCARAARQIEEALLATGPGSVHSLDGAAEDTSRLLARLLSHTLLPGLQIYRVTDTSLCHSREVGEQIWDKACAARDKDKPRAAARYLASLLQLGPVRGEGNTVFSDISADQWSRLFGFAHPGGDLGWADALIGTIAAGPAATKDPLERLLAVIEAGLPANNLLLLTAEHVDKRKKLFTQIKKFGEIIDCSVAEGSSKAAVDQQKEVIREMVNASLAALGKTIEPRALELLFERVGFHPVGAVLEAEKLALYIDERPTIASRDLEVMTGRTREDAVFQLTEALDDGDAGRLMTVLDHLLADGVHPLAIIASLRNHLRRRLIFKALQGRREPAWRPMSSGDFQNAYLPALKETGLWPDLLKAHPYALYQGFTKASRSRPAALKQALALLLEAEFKLKGSPLPGRLIIEELLLSLRLLQRPSSGGGEDPSGPI